MAKYKLQELTQQKSAMDYTIQFQTYATQIKWNNKVLIAQYRQRLKVEVQSVIILIKDSKDIRKLIKQAIKVDNRIYQSKKAKKELNKLP